MINKDKNKELLEKNYNDIVDNIKKHVYSQYKKGQIQFTSINDRIDFAVSWLPMIADGYDEEKMPNFIKYVTWIAMRRVNNDIKDNTGPFELHSPRYYSTSESKDNDSFLQAIDKFSGFNDVEWEDAKAFICNAANKSFKNKIVAKVITDYIIPKCENDDTTGLEFAKKMGISECYVSVIVNSQEVKEFFKVIMPKIGYTNI